MTASMPPRTEAATSSVEDAVRSVRVEPNADVPRRFEHRLALVFELPLVDRRLVGCVVLAPPRPAGAAAAQRPTSRGWHGIAKLAACSVDSAATVGRPLTPPDPGGHLVHGHVRRRSTRNPVFGGQRLMRWIQSRCRGSRRRGSSALAPTSSGASIMCLPSGDGDGGGWTRLPKTTSERRSCRRSRRSKRGPPLSPPVCLPPAGSW